MENIDPHDAFTWPQQRDIYNTVCYVPHSACTIREALKAGLAAAKVVGECYLFTYASTAGYWIHHTDEMHTLFVHAQGALDDLWADWWAFYGQDAWHKVS